MILIGLGLVAIVALFAIVSMFASGASMLAMVIVLIVGLGLISGGLLGQMRTDLTNHIPPNDWRAARQWQVEQARHQQKLAAIEDGQDPGDEGSPWAGLAAMGAVLIVVGVIALAVQ